MFGQISVKIIIFWPFTKSYWNWLQVAKFIIYDLKWTLLCLNNPQHTSNDDIGHLDELWWKVEKSLFYPQIPSEFQRAECIKNQWKCDFPTFHQSPYRYSISSSEVCLVLFGIIKTRIKPYIMYTATSDRFQYTFVKSPFSPWKMAILGHFWQNHQYWQNILVR